MAPALTEGSVATASTVAWGLATTGLLLLFLLLLCSFFHRANEQFSTQKMKQNSGFVQGVKLARLGSSEGEGALPEGIPSSNESQQQVDGPTVPRDQDNPTVEAPRLHGPDWTLHSHALSDAALRTPEFLRHRQLPGLPTAAGTPAAGPVPDAAAPIYESIRYKAGMPKKNWDSSSAQEDFPSLPAGNEPSPLVQEIITPVQEIIIPVQEIIILEEPSSEGSSCPVYAQVCKPPRAPQPHQPTGPPEPQEEAPPSLPEKHFDVA